LVSLRRVTIEILTPDIHGVIDAIRDLTHHSADPPEATVNIYIGHIEKIEKTNPTRSKTQ